jgi:TolA-binding protein
LYSIYQEQKYEEVLTLGDDLLVIFSGTPMASKVALLMANASGRLDGVEVWKEKLKSIIKEYPSSEVAVQAKTFLFTLENNEKI